MLSTLGMLKIIHRKGKRPPSDLNCNYEIITLGIDSKHNDLLSLLSYILSCICYFTLKRIVGEINKNTIVYTNFEYSIIVGIWSRTILRLRWIADFFDDPHRTFLNALYKGVSKLRYTIEHYLLKLYKQVLSRADVVICNSPNLRVGLGAILLKDFNLDKRKLIPVSSGVCVDYILSCTQDTDLNNSVSKILKDNKVSMQYIYIVGHFNRYTSGVYELLKAVEILREENMKFHVVLAGICKKEEKIWLDGVLSKLNLQTIVSYIGIVDQPLSYVLMKKAAICMCLYQTEQRPDYETAYPIKLLEYLTIGIPTISVSTTITKEIIKKFGYGVLIPKCSVTDIVSGVKAISKYERKKTAPCIPETYQWKNINRGLRASIQNRLTLQRHLK